jgi:hypothetical protein
MKFLIRASFPTEIGNQMVKDPNFLKNMEDYIKHIDAEAVYFTVYEGERTAYFVMEVPSPKEMFGICESLFMMGAKVQRDMVMSLEDLKNGFS